MAISMTNVAVNTQADALARLLDGGQVRVYSGTLPATADSALSGNTLLATLTLSATSAPAAVAGVLTFNTIASAAAAATGTATFYRLLESDGTTVLVQGEVGLAGSGKEMIMNSTAIQSGATVAASSLTHTVPK